MPAKLKINFIFYIFFICFVSIITADANELPYFCELKISYNPSEDGQAYEVFHREPNKMRAKTKIFHGEHPSLGPFKQLGVKIIGDICYKNELTGQIAVDNPNDIWIKGSEYNVQKHEYSLKNFILVFLDDKKTDEENENCSDKWWTSFEEHQSVILKVADIWQGTTAHYSTAYAIAPENIMIDGKWLCS